MTIGLPAGVNSVHDTCSSKCAEYGVFFDFLPVARHIWRMLLSDWGRQVAQQRRARRLTQRALAAAAGISARSLQRLEAGDGGVALETFMRTLAALGLEAHLRPRGRPTLDELADFYDDAQDDGR